MITGIENRERYTAYPFIEDSLMNGTDGISTFIFPNDVIKDLQFYSLNESRGDLKLMALTAVSGASRDLVFEYSAPDSDSYSINVSVANGSPEDSEQTVKSAGVYSIKLRFGPGINKLFDTALMGADACTFAGIPVEPSLIRSENKHYVTSVAGSNLKKLIGDIEFKEGYNISINVVPGDNAIEFSAEVGAGLGVPCEYFFTRTCCEDCDEVELVSGNCNSYIFYINGLHPDWYGNFIIDGGPGIIVSSPGGNIIDITADVNQNNPECNEDD